MKYAVLFRGINVGGKNIVKMADLRQFLTGLGLEGVKTYVQSGNAVFESEFDETALRGKIRTGFTERFGFESHVIIRNTDELRFLIKHLPFTPEEIASAEAADPNVDHLYVYFLEHSPEQAQIDFICREFEGADIIKNGQRELYLLCRESIRKSKRAARLSKIFDTATVRNWKSVCNLYELLKID